MSEYSQLMAYSLKYRQNGMPRIRETVALAPVELETKQKHLRRESNITVY